MYNLEPKPQELDSARQKIVIAKVHVSPDFRVYRMEGQNLGSFMDKAVSAFRTDEKSPGTCSDLPVRH